MLAWGRPVPVDPPLPRTDFLPLQVFDGSEQKQLPSTTEVD
jgi:hypothetical protein